MSNFTDNERRNLGWAAVIDWVLVVLSLPFPWLIDWLPVPIVVFMAVGLYLLPWAWLASW